MSVEHVLIVGSGFAGLGMGIRLKQKGIHDFTILEQGPRIGGTWRDNDYPGAACDVESHLYSFSFDTNPKWTRTFAPQGEILSYLEGCADRWQLRPHIRLNTAATGAEFDERSGTWSVHCSDGTTRRARILIPACGGLSRPSVPDLPGLNNFEGTAFHSARWDHSFPFEGKNVAVIGTGASAIQIVPAIAPRVGQLHVFQRTPPWILPKRDRDISAREQRGFARVPLRQQFVRASQYWMHELVAFGFVLQPKMLALASGLGRRHLEESVHDPVLRDALTPRYTMGCKRILLSNDYYPALQRSNVELVTSPLKEIRAHSIATADGRERPIDAIILSTGFQAAELKAPFDLRGARGAELNAAWRDGPEAYLGTTVAGFPNFFLLIGPNTGLGHSSMIFMMESQMTYILDAIDTMKKKKLRSVEVRADAQRQYNDEIQERLARSVWSTGGCVSWYQTRTGKNTTLWPGFTFEYRYRTRRFDVDAYDRLPR